ncbi:YheE family protein [Halalkalibacterium halodurans]|jgi:hypothetical protein|uniref:BH1143 protein n=2 Tax=Halalkalibacterium halodurans TaxID=86665 RepID=Q9KDR8_HALH5|nr:YheE family protein [Halalkalibacterium halodurans]MDY7221675.1 YheE family protein [Halalkalibacterium halodurans]MDY7240951.1 YheE family protein [Halalkalibacterium halodurans]MED3647482.1 YheE family protein [Halalkalibacterium halodurans]MED4079346.1 YheE family protein [Halalkalibacterium halodurans]MED4085417.1 YheE family protein [Halalkalibacterium halodurans]
MISHFQWKELRNNLLRREWSFSFFTQGTYYHGIYDKEGAIHWGTPAPSDALKQTLEPKIHDLMLYHIYEEH